MKKIILVVAFLVVAGLAGLYAGYSYVKSTLPKLITINDYSPLLVSKVYDRNNKQIGEFFREKRELTPYVQIPEHVVKAFLAAEDDEFFKHSGINYLAIMRAAFANLRAGKNVQGGSTITQQVAKTLMLSSEKTILRKVKDALLAQEMEAHLTKQEILYLYLNQIYFGQGAYGIGSAAETYFRKDVKNLTIAEAAILAGLPKAPSAYSPTVNPKRAKERQNYVLRRMRELGYITAQQSEDAIKKPLKVYMRERFESYAPFYLETVRQMLVAKLGEEAVLDQGLRIYTSLDLDKQLAAQEAMQKGLKELDKRQGFRGPLKNMTDPKEVGNFLFKTRNQLIAQSTDERIIQPDGSFTDYGELNLKYDIKKGLPFYLKEGSDAEGIVAKVDDKLGLVFIRVGEIEALINFETMDWARKPDADKNYLYDKIKKPSDALKVGDVVLVKIISNKFAITPKITKALAERKKSDPDYKIDFTKYGMVELDQEPIAESSLISFDQQTQDVLAMIGGYDFKKSEYNRVLQAARQTGSAFKSIVYASALDKGYTPSTPIMDAPIVYEEVKEDAEGQEEVKLWKPSNHSKSFGGDIILRNALVKSLNVPTVKIIEDIGVNWAADYARRLGIFSPLNMDFTLALGSSGITLYEMTKVFAEFGRLGKKIEPLLVHKVEDAEGKSILGELSLDLRFEKETADINKAFEDRRKSYLDTLANNTPDPNTPDKKPETSKAKSDANFFFPDESQLIKPTTAYLITSLLKAVVEDPSGTGARAKSLGREIAGKTGTTNGYNDAWFIGFSPQISTGVWVGFDQDRSIGKGEVGGRAALPIWLDYMKSAHEGLPQMTFRIPDGIVFANIDSDTGRLASRTSKKIVKQAYLEGTEPLTEQNDKQEETDFYKQDLSE